MVATIPCPFRNCKLDHEVRVAKNGKMYVSCDGWLNRAFANTDLARDWFKNGGARPRSAAGGGNMPNPPNYITCPKCNSGVVQGQDRCHECGVLLEWDQWRETNPAPTKKPKKSYKIDPDLGF